MNRKPDHDTLPPSPADEADIEIWEPDEVDRIRSAGTRGLRRRLTASAPGAVAGVFLVCALAFGATLQATGGPGKDHLGSPAGHAGDGRTADVVVEGSGISYDSYERADADSADDTKDGDTSPDGDSPVTEPAATEPTAIGLELALGDGGGVRLAWGACAVGGFVAWKLVRSTDSGVAFPTGANDTLVGAIEDQARTAAKDTSAPAGKKLWYAVFGLARDGEASRVACRSAVRAIQTPTPKPAPEPAEKPASTTSPGLGLTLAVKEGAVVIDFTECKADGADYYKVVRSSDSTVKWPAGDNDTLVAAVEMGGKTLAWDKGAPSGKKAWYRVFCVRHTEDGYKVLASSAAKSITAPVKDPAPEPTAMWIEVAVDGGNVVVSWEACGGEAFSHYRIVRKSGDTATVIAEIENAGTTTWVDDSVEPDGTYRYLVQAKGNVDGSYVLLGSTDWAAVTVG